MKDLFGQEAVDQIREDAGVLPGQFDPKSIEQRWDELDAVLLGVCSRDGGTYLSDDETDAAAATRALLLAVLAQCEISAERFTFMRRGRVQKRIEALGK